MGWNAFGRETVIVFQDFGREAQIQTSSRKLYETLMVAGVRCEEVDGIFVARVPKRWLRLRTPCGLLHLGWYPSARERSAGVLALFEDRPRLRVLRPGERGERNEAEPAQAGGPRRRGGRHRSYAHHAPVETNGTLA